MEAKGEIMFEGETGAKTLIERKSIADQVFHYIKRMILSGALKAGERIPESGVANELHVSRTPVREAIRKLAEYGLVVIKPWSYAVVASIDGKEARDIAVVRLALERLSFRTVAGTVARDDLAPLYELAQRCLDANSRGDYATVHVADSSIHLGVAERTGNRELVNTLRALDAKFQLLRLKQYLPPEKLALYLEQHELLLRLLEENDVEKIDELLEQHIVHHLEHVKEM